MSSGITWKDTWRGGYKGECFPCPAALMEIFDGRGISEEAP